MNVVALWQGLPAAWQEGIRRASVSAGLSLQTGFLVLVGAAAQANQVGSPGALFHYILGNWWSVAIALILPLAFRARQGVVAAANTVTLGPSPGFPSGGKAVVTETKGP
jgi:hypothetical protein